MINEILAVWLVSPLAVLVLLVALGTPVLLVVLLVRHLSRSSKERWRLRLEVGKLADEVHILRQETKPSQEEPADKIE